MSFNLTVEIATSAGPAKCSMEVSFAAIGATNSDGTTNKAMISDFAAQTVNKLIATVGPSIPPDRRPRCDPAHTITPGDGKTPSNPGLETQQVEKTGGWFDKETGYHPYHPNWINIKLRPAIVDDVDFRGEPRCKVSGLKELYQTKKGVSAWVQRLVHNGAELSSDDTLEEAGVEDGDIIYVYK